MINNSMAAVIESRDDIKRCINEMCDGIGSLEENHFSCDQCKLNICWFCKVTNSFGHECVGDQKEKNEKEFR